MAMYKTRNAGTGNGMRGTRGIRGMLYSGECRQTFRWMSSNILGNVAKHSGECRQTFRGMLPNIPGNAAKHSGECCQTFRGMLPNIPENVAKHSGECPKKFRGMSPNISGNVLKHSEECHQTFWGMSSKIQRIFENYLWHVVKHCVESMKGFGWMYLIARDTGDHELYW